MNLKRCPICRRVARTLRHPYHNKGPHKHPLFENLTLLRCCRCDSMWCCDSPSKAALSSYYARSYTPARMGHVADDRWPIWDSRPVSLIMLARMFCEFAPGDLFIDVGPGNGASLSLAPLMLPDPQLGCVEFNETSIMFFRRHAPEMKIANKIEEFATGSARIVYSAHSLEHYRPDEALDGLRAIRRVLGTSSALALEVPLATSARTVAARRHTPHLMFFSPSGLTKIVEAAGFHVQLCCTTKGRPGNLEIAKQLSPPADIGNRLAIRLAAVNTGDLVAALPRTDQPVRGALKLIATPR